jgi:hypothetical protein
MSSLHDGYQSSLRSTTADSEKGSARKLVELLARMGQPNGFANVAQATSTYGKQWVRIASTLGFRIKSNNATGTSLTFRRYAANQDAGVAVLSTALTGNNNDLDYTSVPRGLAGNDTTIAYVDPSGNNQVLGVVVTGQAIVVNLATGAGGAITSTSALIKAAIEASPTASALVTVAHKAGNDGSGVVIAMGATNLAGGTDATVPTVVVASAADIDLPCIANANEWEVKRTDNSATAVTLRALMHKMV